MNTVYVIEWTFTPPDYFEQSIRIVKDNYEMTIDNGKVTAKVDEKHYYLENNLRDLLSGELNDRFLGAQLINYTPYKLSGPSVHKLLPDGRIEHILDIHSASHIHVSENVDILIKDGDGNIIGDTRRNRLAEKKSIADLMAKHRNNNLTLTSITNSFNEALNDPKNELVHLYEIRDAIQDKYGGQKAACNDLGLNTGEWDKLGNLANNRKQGRHRGQQVGVLPDATENELNEARNIAQKMIMSYMDFLENQG